MCFICMEIDSLNIPARLLKYTKLFPSLLCGVWDENMTYNGGNVFHMYGD